MELVSPDVFKVVITAAIGPLKAKFNGTLNVTEANAPHSCVLIFEGQGGAVGFGKGSSSVTLKPVDGGTELTYSAQAHVGGKLAQIGSRLIDSVAKKMSDDFFKAFNKELGAQSAPSQENTSFTENSAPIQQQPTSPVPVAISSINTSSTPNVQASNSGHQVPASWLIIAAAVGAGIVIIAELILK